MEDRKDFWRPKAGLKESRGEDGYSSWVSCILSLLRGSKRRNPRAQAGVDGCSKQIGRGQFPRFRPKGRTFSFPLTGKLKLRTAFPQAAKPGEVDVGRQAHTVPLLLRYQPEYSLALLHSAFRLSTCQG